MNPTSPSYRWYALQVRTRWESSTAVLLGGKGYETLLPTFAAKKGWSGRQKSSNAPLFPGYVFCQFNVHDRLPVLVTPGVISVIGRGKVPVAIEDAEISAIQQVMSAGVTMEPWPYLEIGQRVRIETASMQGVEGILLNFKGNNRIVLSVSLLRRSVALEIDRDAVSPIGAGQGTSLQGIAARQLVPDAVS